MDDIENSGSSNKRRVKNSSKWASPEIFDLISISTLTFWQLVPTPNIILRFCSPNNTLVYFVELYSNLPYPGGLAHLTSGREKTAQILLVKSVSGKTSLEKKCIFNCLKACVGSQNLGWFLKSGPKVLRNPVDTTEFNWKDETCAGSEAEARWCFPAETK